MISAKTTSFGLRFAAAAALSLAAASSTASAGLTEVRTARPESGEASIDAILAHKYGGTFTSTAGGYTNGSLTVTRVDDLTDSAWKGSSLTVNPVASFSRSEQTLGLMVGKSGGGYEELFSVNQFGYLPGSPTAVDTSGSFWRFALDNSATTLRTSSLAADNANADQMVTYRVDGLGDGKSTYMLFWEDTPVGASDRDFNDLVVEAKLVGGPSAVPLPPGVIAGGATLVGVGMLSAYKRRKRATA